MKFVKDFFVVVLMMTFMTTSLTVANAESIHDNVEQVIVNSPDDKKLKQFLSHIGNDVLPGPWLGKKDKENETPKERRERINMISEVTVDEANVAAGSLGWFWSVSDLALAAYIKMWNESGRFRLKVHNGKIRGDNGKSVCLGQIMNGKKSLIGTDRESTRRCVAEVMKHLVMHQRRCLNEVTPPSPWAMSKVYAGYGTGYSCKENASMTVKDAFGNPVLDAGGKPKRDYWARKRGYTWWRIREKLIKI